MGRPSRARVLVCTVLALGAAVTSASVSQSRTTAAATGANSPVSVHANRNGMLISSRRAGAPTTPIQHVIILMKENRSYDDYFGAASGAQTAGLPANPIPAGDGATTAYDRYLKTTISPLPQTPEPMPTDLGHGPPDFNKSCDMNTTTGVCRMDGFSREAGSNCTTGSTCKLASTCNCYLSLTQMASSGYSGTTPCTPVLNSNGQPTNNIGPLPNYWCYAETYGLSDRTFSDFIGGSFVNNVMSVAGQGGGGYAQQMCPQPNDNPAVGDPIFGPCAPAANMSAYGNPNPAGTCDSPVTNGSGQVDPKNLPQANAPPALACWGCDDYPSNRAPLQNETGTALAGGTTGPTMFPCYPFASLPDELTANQIPWRFYADPANKDFQHVSIDALQSVRYNQTEWQNLRPLTQFYDTANPTNANDLTAPACTTTSLPNDNCLPAVSWVEGDHSEHPVNTACVGENETVNFLNALMQSANWSTTAVFITWDEWGGFFDHVPPPTKAQYPGLVDNISFGFRIPMLVISPWTKVGTSVNGGYVSHPTGQFYSETSQLKFIEYNWGIPALNSRDGSPALGDMTDFFDFSQATPRPPLRLVTHACKHLTAAEQQVWSTEADD